VVSQVVVYTHASFRLKVAEIHDVYMVLSGGNMCEEVHPCRVIIIYSNSRVLGYGLLGKLMWYIDNLKWIL
jgi:hypothetical protein